MKKTTFPMRGNLPNKEPIRREKWETEDVYGQGLNRTKDRPLFILHDGPPYANGDLHIGHALNQILKDFITRYKSMTGIHAKYIYGLVTHVFPIEISFNKMNIILRENITHY